MSLWALNSQSCSIAPEHNGLEWIKQCRQGSQDSKASGWQKRLEIRF